MKNFKILENLTIYKHLDEQLTSMLSKKLIKWDPTHNQICLNTIPGYIDDYHLGTGSLLFDWSQHTLSVDDTSSVINLPLRKAKLKEEDFTILCSAFNNTMFEEIYKELSSYYVLGRIRLMRSLPKTCMSWHRDTSLRIHYPIKTQEGCFMVIDDEVVHLEKNKWWETNTLNKHTAVNSSNEDRVHLVVCVLEEK